MPTIGGSTAWRERYQGGSPEVERRAFEAMAGIVLDAQVAARKAAGTSAVERACYAATIAATSGARLVFADDLPDALRVDFAQPGAAYPAAVRFSGSGIAARGADLRGLAVAVEGPCGRRHDLVAANWPVSHARDARQYVACLRADAGSALGRPARLAALAAAVGPGEALRMLRVIHASRRTCASVALETYWACGATRWGDLAVRYSFSPARDTARSRPAGASSLSNEIEQRLREGDVRFDLYLQGFVDERTTPIEDASVEWHPSASPQVRVATLIVPRRDLASTEALADRRMVEGMGFNPWNTTEAFRPLGNINRARKVIYDASRAHRGGTRWHAEPLPWRNRIIGGGVRWSLRQANRRVPWHRMPLRLGLLNLDALRHDLRAWNLVDAEQREAPPAVRAAPAEPTADERIYRSHDGRGNDLSDPAMGAVGATFGRNMPRDHAAADAPNAVLVARELLDRKTFIPARTLNVLAAAWIQFQVHDWVAHARKAPGEDDVVVPIPNGYPDWISRPGGPAAREMRISGNVPHPAAPEPWVFANATSHWWDGSEVYGADDARAMQLREGDKLRLTEDGYLPTDLSGLELTGFNESWWMGLSAMHTLFAREHNVIVDELRRAYPGWSDMRRYETARLIVSALIAKIHTLEWTPAILGTEALDTAMRVNWSGPPSGDWLTRLGLWLTDIRALRGIPQSFPDHHGVPYSLTEEFATVYRLHPLIPDDYIFRDHATGSERERCGFLDIQGDRADDWMRRIGLTDALHSFGVAHPGAIALHNFPRSLQRFERDGEIVDLSVLDIVRTRHRRVPRYCAFRRALRMPEFRGWDELTPSAEFEPTVPRDLRPHRGRRYRRRPARRATARRLRLFRHRLPHLRTDGLAAVAVRPVSDGGLPIGNLLASRDGLDRAELHEERHPAPLSRPGGVPAP